MIEYIAAAACIAIGVAYYRHNMKLMRQDNTEPEKKSFHTVSGFDYTAAKEQSDRQQRLLRQYEQVNRLQDDLIVARKSGETMTIQLSRYDHCGELQSLSMDVPPEWLQEFTRLALDDLTEKCSTSLSEKCE